MRRLTLVAAATILGCANPIDVFGEPPASFTAEWVAAGFAHTCLIEAGALFCFGQNSGGQLGVGDKDDRALPTRVGAETDWVRVECGEQFTCGIRAGGEVYCWGLNAAGQLGLGATDPGEALAPVAVVGLPGPAIALGVGFDHACAITQGGELYCWGENWEAAIGNGSPGRSAPSLAVPTPTRIGSEQTWHAVAAGHHSTCAAAVDQVYCWGRNFMGTLGVGARDDARFVVPTPIVSGAFDSVRADQDNFAAMRGGSAYLWGWNDNLQLGMATESEIQSTPLEVEGRAFSSLDINAFGGCGVTLEGGLVCWGWLPPGAERMPMTERGAERDWVQISMGRFHRCGRRASGAVLCAGENDFGQLGQGHLDALAEYAEVRRE